MLPKRRGAGREGIRLARLRPGHDVKHGGRVTNAVADDAVGTGAFPDLALRRAHRHPATTGAKAEQAAHGRRDANRTAAVIGTRHRHDARRHRGSRAAAGTARRQVKLPGVARRPPQQRLGGAFKSQLRGIGLAKNDQPGLEPLLDHVGVARRHVVAQRPRSAGGRHAGVVLDQVLDQKRHTGEEAIKRLPGARLGLASHVDDDGVDVRVDRRRPRPGEGQQFNRRGLAAGDDFGKAEAVQLSVFIEIQRQLPWAIFRVRIGA